MAEYLGETPVESLDGTPFAGFGPAEWAMEFIGQFGQIDGSHHKQWVLDQVARILRGTPVTVVLARWDDGDEEYRIATGEPSDAYLQWVDEMQGGWDEENECYEYQYDEGIPP